MELASPKVMGILNITPDSFYEKSRLATEKDILGQAERMLVEGAAMLDIGGYSTRPGAADVSEEIEQDRVVKAVRSVIKHFPQAIVSVDSFRSKVAKAAVDEGACIINDVSGGTLDSLMFETVAELQVPYILMHMRGSPQTMNSLTHYNNLVGEVLDFFHPRVSALRALGVKDVVVDPGIGFAKKVEQNFSLLNHLEHFKILGKPMVVGLSRKSLIWRTLNGTPEESLNGTTALNMAALLKGVSILRVHDVKEAVETVRLYSSLIAAS
jgi:dihydropteroate synthase